VTLQGYPGFGFGYQVLDGMITSDSYGDCNFTLGSGGSAPGYSGAPVFRKHDGALIGMNVAGPSLNDFFASFKDNLSLLDLMHGAKNATHNLIISIRGGSYKALKYSNGSGMRSAFRRRLSG